MPFGRLETVCGCAPFRYCVLEQEQGMVRRLEVDGGVCDSVVVCTNLLFLLLHDHFHLAHLHSHVLAKCDYSLVRMRVPTHERIVRFM